MAYGTFARTSSVHFPNGFDVPDRDASGASSCGSLMRHLVVKKPAAFLRGQSRPREVLRGGRQKSLGGFLIGKLRPDSLPIIRAQVFAGDLAVGGLLDGGAAFDRHIAAINPSPYKLRLNADLLG